MGKSTKTKNEFLKKTTISTHKKEIKNKDKQKNKHKQLRSSLLFFIITSSIFLGIIIAFPHYSHQIIKSFLSILKKLLPIFGIIFLLFIIMNFFIKKSFLIKHLGRDSGIKAWFFTIIAGLLSAGPIYMWFDLLSHLKKQGVRTAFVVTFLYNRSIKLALLPIIIAYFSLRFAIVLLVVMVFFSIIQGLVVEHFTN